MFYELTEEDIEIALNAQDKILEDACERIRKMLDDAQVVMVKSFYDDSNPSTAEQSWINKFNEIGMPNSVSPKEIEQALDYHNTKMNGGD